MSNTRCHQAHLLRVRCHRHRRSSSPLATVRCVRVVLIIIIYQLPPETITDGREIVIWVLLDFGHTPNNSLRRSRNKRHPALFQSHWHVVYLHPRFRDPHLWYYYLLAVCSVLSTFLFQRHTHTRYKNCLIDLYRGQKIIDILDKKYLRG